MSQAFASSSISESHDNAQYSILCLAVIPKDSYSAFPLYWLKTDSQGACPPDLIEALRDVLVDGLKEELWYCEPNGRDEWMGHWSQAGFGFWLERQFMPGVTDNLAHTVQEALTLKGFETGVQVASGSGHLFNDFASAHDVEQAAKYHIFHPLTDRIKVHDLRLADRDLLTFPAVHLPEPKPAVPVDLEALDDAGLESLSKERLLALTLGELKAVRQHYRQDRLKEARAQQGLCQSPTDVELEIIAQTWSEHCKHKIFNATINYTDHSVVPFKQNLSIRSLYKTYIQGATKKLSSQRPDLLSVFEDNSGVVRWNDKYAVCFKVETHNSPSALEPYGGALTGILGVNRDILGTGLGAKPIFNTDIFCFAYPSDELPERPKLLPPKAILDGVRRGVEDGGNKSGIPTVNGAIFFDPSYRAKPLVFCGTGGILPLVAAGQLGFGKHTKTGDTVVMVGGRVGKDGIHGATFSSESLHEGSPMSAVQIGDPFTQKRMLDFVLEARDKGLITGITDNGAGGLSSSVGEMAQLTGGASIELNHVPTKYPGLADWEIVVSESQERMTISTRDMDGLKKLGLKHHVEATDIGTFHDHGYFEVTRGGKTVALLELNFLHNGVPTLELDAEFTPAQITINIGGAPKDFQPILLQLLAHPNVVSREAIIRRYDHEVQGASVIKPLMGPRQQAPCDAAVIKPLLDGESGLVVSNGLCPRLSQFDAYLMAVCAADEAIRNAVCVGADPATICLLDNFCWPDPVFSAQNRRGKEILGQLVRACQGLHNAVVGFGTPLISGKDSMKNDFDDGVVRLSVAPTLLVSAIGKIPMSDQAISMEFKDPGDLIYMLSAGVVGLSGSYYEELQSWQSTMTPAIDVPMAAKLYAKLHEAIIQALIKSAHDLSEGGLAVALSECIIGSGLGAEIDVDALTQIAKSDPKSPTLGPTPWELETRPDILLFGEGPARIIITVAAEDRDAFEMRFTEGAVYLGTVSAEPRLKVDATIASKTGSNKSRVLDVPLTTLEAAWKTPLPFD